MACGPRVRPDDPSEAPAVSPAAKSSSGGGPGRQWLVGEICPQAAAGRPAVAPLFLRGVGWSDHREEVASPIARGAASEFWVFGFDGRRAGGFAVVGAAEAGLPQDVAVGSYLGASPCTLPGSQTEEPACAQILRGCALAVSRLGASEEARWTPAAGGACRAGDAVAVDIDGDGRIERFPIARFVDPVRAPADEVTSESGGGNDCTPHFTVLGLEVPREAEVAADPRYRVTLDVLGVLDVDGDGRHELFIALRYGEGRTIAAYAAGGRSSRLELVGEAVSWTP